jgi:hypothetical protein
MFTHHETHHAPQHRGKPAKFRRNDRRAAIARKTAFLIDGLTVRH